MVLWSIICTAIACSKCKTFESNTHNLCVYQQARAFWSWYIRLLFLSDTQVHQFAQYKSGQETGSKASKQHQHIRVHFMSTWPMIISHLNTTQTVKISKAGPGLNRFEVLQRSKKDTYIKRVHHLLFKKMGVDVCVSVWMHGCKEMVQWYPFCCML